MNLMTRLKSVFRGSSQQTVATQWPKSADIVPWFDRLDARDILQQRYTSGRYTEDEHVMLSGWIDNGYVILENLVSADAVDAMTAELEAVWEATTAINGLRIEQIKVEEHAPAGLTHEQLLQIPLERRLEMRNSQLWRVHGFYRFSEKANAIYQNKEIKRVCSLLFDCEAEPHYSINFMYGSRQELHQDTAVFHVYPQNFLIGAWLACEDISSDAGPLVYYPGSHRVPLYREFDDYPQTNLRTCALNTTYNYNAHVQSAAEKFKRHQFLAKKGDILLWHGLLIHGGDTVHNTSLTRKSHVTHYIPQGMDKSTEVHGPFNWG